MDGAVIGVLGVVVGTMLGAFLQEWRARNDEARSRRRDGAQRLAEYNLRRLTETRRAVRAEADWFLAWAVGDDRQLESALEVVHALDQAYGDTTLIGSDEAVLRWIRARDGVIARGRMRSQDPAHVQEIYDSRDQCFDAIDAQIDRALAGEPLVTLGPEARGAIGRASIVDSRRPAS